MAGTFTRRLRARLFAGLAIAALLANSASGQTTTTYYYDALGRVIGAGNSDGKAVGYSYDPAGNRTQVTNVVPFDELIPIAFTSSTTTAGDGLTIAGGMRDGVFNAAATVHGTAGAANEFITANFGAVKTLDHVDIAPANFGTWSAANLNGVQVQSSIDNVTWTTAATTAGAVLNQYLTIPMGGVSAQYVRLFRPAATAIAVGDFRFWGRNATGNQPPQADSFSVAVPTAGGTIDLATHIRDPEGDPLAISTFNIPTAAAHGTVVKASNTTFTYTPTAGSTANDSFSYAISDGHNSPVTGLISVTIAATPVVHAVSSTVAFNSSANNIPLSITGTATSVAVASSPTQGGSASPSGLGISYTPRANYSGPDSFTYTASNAFGTSAPATVSITVNPAAPTPPVVNAVSVTIPFNTTGNFIAANLSGGTATSVAMATNPTHGSASVSGFGFIYTPTPNYSGPDLFGYTASGPGGPSNGGAQVSIQVVRPPPPTVDPTSLTVAENTSGTVALLGHGDIINYEIFSGPSHGSASVSGSNAIYTPTTGYAGPDSFTYGASGNGGTSFTATVSVTVTGVPTFSADVDTQGFERFWDGSTWSAAPSVNVIVSGGSGSYRYDWEPATGVTGFTLFGQGTSAASWIYPNTDTHQIFNEQWICNVTDTVTGARVTTRQVTVTLDLTVGV